MTSALSRTCTWLATCLLWPASAPAWPSPQVAIEQFLAYEFDGGRLDNTGGFIASRLPYLHMPAGYDEPGWDIVERADAYTIEHVRCESTIRCSAEVSFHTDDDGVSDPRVGAQTRRAPDTARYVIVNVDGEWLTSPPKGPPRVSSARIVIDPR